MTRDPTLEEMLNDPIVQILMRRDRVNVAGLRALMHRLKRRASSSKPEVGATNVAQPRTPR
jgi:hypothetical protein